MNKKEKWQFAAFALYCTIIGVVIGGGLWFLLYVCKCF